MGRANTKTDQLEYIMRISQQFKFVKCSWRGSVYDCIVYTIKEWNKNNSDEIITKRELNIHDDRLEELKNCYFPKTKIEKKKINGTEDLVKMDKQKQVSFLKRVVRENSHLSIKWKFNIFAYICFAADRSDIDMKELGITQAQKDELCFKYFSKKTNTEYEKNND